MATPAQGMTRITRLGHAMLGAPVQLVAVANSSASVVAATPADAGAVPLEVARRLTGATGVTTITAPDGTRWSGAAVGRWVPGMRVALCTSAADDDRTRAALADLAALAADVLRVDAAVEDAADLRELLGTASHDLRNPLSVLRAGLETLTMHAGDLPAGHTERIADLAARQARRMGSMIDGLLCVTGLSRDEDHEDVDLGQLVRDAVEAARLSHGPVEIELVGALPDGPVIVRGVTDALARLLANLVTNAAIHGGGRVWINLQLHGQEASITVADDGPGMPANSALGTGERVHRTGGHGLGLVIARRIVTAHGGSIGHHERAGGGTIVEFTLALAE